METALSKASQMFSYLRDKDIFVDAYRKQLAKRLLTLKARDGGVAESDAIALLKERMGAAFTAKLEGMMNDITQNDQRHSEFTNYLNKPEEVIRQSRAGALHDEMGEDVLSPTKKKDQQQQHQLDFSPSRPPDIEYELRVQLLTNGHWPTTKTLSFDLPKLMRKGQAVFERFYMVVTANRKVRWAHALGTVVMIGHYSNHRQVEMVMSELQCAILLCMSSNSVIGGGITLRALQTMLGVDNTDLLKHLTPMIRGKYHLIEDGKGSDISAGMIDVSATLRINREYSIQDGQKRIKLPIGLGKIGKKKKSKSSSHGNNGGNRSPRGGGSSNQVSPRISSTRGDDDDDITPRSATKVTPKKEQMQGGAEIAGSNDVTSAEVRESRKILSDAAIVKIMKREKKCMLRPLVEKVKREVSNMWSASGAQLSKRIEDLIERDYLERDENDQRTLLYVP